MKTCPSCHTFYRDDDKKFCKKCGTALVTAYSIPEKEIAKKMVFEDRLKADPLNKEILHEFAQFLFANHLYEETIPIALKILVLSENDLQALELLFQSYLKRYKRKEAIEVGKQLLQIKPADIDLLSTLAEIAAGIEQNEEALFYCDSALKLDSANQNMHFNKALILLKENKVEKAIKSFKEAFALGNNDRITLIYVGIDKALNADYESAINQLTPVLTDSFVNPEDLNYNRGFLYLAYSLYQNKFDISEILSWIRKIKVEVLKKNHHSLDESAWVSIVKFLIVNNLNIIPSSSKVKSKMDILINTYILIDTYLINDYFTPVSNQTIAEIWYDVGNKQLEVKLFDDAISSFNKSLGLHPKEEKYKEAINEAKEKAESQQKKNKRKIIIAVVFSLIIVVVIISAAFTFKYLNEKHSWEKAVQKNTANSYRSYMNKYPKGRFIIDAKTYYEDALWKEIKSVNQIISYKKYLSLYKNGGKYSVDAKTEIAKSNVEKVYNNGVYEFELLKDEILDHWIIFPDGGIFQFTISSPDYNYKTIFSDGDTIKGGKDVQIPDKKFAKLKFKALSDQTITLQVKQKK